MNIDILIRLLETRNIDDIRIGLEFLLAKYGDLQSVNEVITNYDMYFRLIGGLIHLGYNGYFHPTHEYLAPEWRSFDI